MSFLKDIVSMQDPGSASVSSSSPKLCVTSHTHTYSLHREQAGVADLLHSLISCRFTFGPKPVHFRHHHLINLTQIHINAGQFLLINNKYTTPRVFVDVIL